MCIYRFSPQGRFRSISVAFLATLLSVILAPGVHAQTVGCSTCSPTYDTTLGDCTVGSARGLNGTTDRLPGGDLCDDYDNDNYERPLSQSASVFYDALDITSAQYGMDDTWFYFSLDLFGIDASTDDLPYEYGVALDLDQDFRGDFFVKVDGPNVENFHDTDWTDKVVSIYFDSNMNTGYTDPQASDCSGGTCPSITDEGYDCQFYVEGEMSNPPAMARVDPTDDTVVEFAIKKSYLLTHDDSDCSGDNRFIASPPATFDPIISGWAMSGNQSVNQMYLNDHYTLSSAGNYYSTCPVEYPSCGAPTVAGGNIYELDTIGGLITLLPVELVSFSAVLDGHQARLEWETASETNNAGFEVQVKTLASTSSAFGGDEWDVLGFVAGHGTTHASQHYRYEIDALSSGHHLFRLKQVDYDGTFDYSPEVEVFVDLPNVYLATAAYPNPFNTETQFSLMVRHEQTVSVTVYDVLGRRIRVLYEDTMAPHQAQSFTFNAQSLPSGVYLISVDGETFSQSQLVTLQK